MDHPRPYTGMLFFDEDGNECGGLVWVTAEANGVVVRGGSLTFDRHRQDQVVQLFHEEAETALESGLRINDMPAIPMHEQQQRLRAAYSSADGAPSPELFADLRRDGLLPYTRAVLARRPDHSVGLTLSDSDGRVRLEVSVDAEGEPHLRLFDAHGKAIWEASS